MWVIKAATLRGFWSRHRDARQPLTDWLDTARQAEWRNINDVRRDFPHADAADVASGATVTVFNIKGNAYRLIVARRGALQHTHRVYPRLYDPRRLQQEPMEGSALMATTHDTHTFRGPPADTYNALIGVLPPRPLHDTTDYDAAVAMIGRLVGYDLNPDQTDYLEALATFVEKYEADHPETGIDAG